HDDAGQEKDWDRSQHPPDDEPEHAGPPSGKAASAPVAVQQGPGPLPWSGSSQIPQHVKPRHEEAPVSARAELGPHMVPEDLDHLEPEVPSKPPRIQPQEALVDRDVSAQPATFPVASRTLGPAGAHLRWPAVCRSPAPTSGEREPVAPAGTGAPLRIS